MGAIFIKGQHEYLDPQTGQMQFFFAIIYALGDGEPQICYDIRHISDKDRSLHKYIVKAPNLYKEEDRPKFFVDQEPIIFRMSAMKVIN